MKRAIFNEESYKAGKPATEVYDSGRAGSSFACGVTVTPQCVSRVQPFQGRAGSK